jgi:hypothetical protein
MASSGMLRRVTLVNSSETSALTRDIRRNITEDAILHSHCRENLKSYIPWPFPRRLKKPEREADRPPPYSALIKNGGAIPPQTQMSS